MALEKIHFNVVVFSVNRLKIIIVQKQHYYIQNICLSYRYSVNVKFILKQNVMPI